MHAQLHEPAGWELEPATAAWLALAVTVVATELVSRTITGVDVESLAGGVT